jgi:hypothetical protein
MSHSCVCGGENEDCRYCGGSGIIGDVLGSALDETIRRLSIENSPTEDIKASPRPWWFPSNISGYVSEYGPTSQKTKPAPPSNPKPERLTPPATPAASAQDPTRQNTTLVAPRDKNLDATKLYAHPYREQGRYGSHPSHDGFDDEDGPE